jgi:hypothetical protein
MTLLATEDYGQLTPLVVTIGTIVSATAAILMGFRGRAKWEPAEEDVSKGPQKVASLLAAVAIVVLWVTQNDATRVGSLSNLAIRCGLATILFLLAYGWLISVYTYKKITSPRTGEANEIKIIGGFRLIESAKEELKNAVISVQQLFAGRGYEEDLVWTRASRAAAKMFFVVSYLGLTICGVIALAAAGMMILLNKPPAVH